MRQSPSHGTLANEVASINRAMARLGDAFKEMARTIKYAIERMYAFTLPYRRGMYGGMVRDARVYPEQWQSYICAGLICGLDDTTCPSDEYDLQCTHSCHRAD